jgi:recombining binding protein (suppressor of hairless)
MTIDHAQLCASNIAWSAFTVNVVRQPGASNAATPVAGPQPVTYGCEIVLSDTHSGLSTSPLVIRKVDKGKVTHDEGGPVSQMQKIALQRVNPDGSRHYLSAAGPIPGATGVVAPPAPGLSSQAGTHPLLFQSPRVREEIKDGFRVVCDEVDDYLCWTIVGISKFQYTFFDAFGQNNNIPELPITPFPTLFTAPVYRPGANSVELTVSNFFYEHPTTRQQTALDVYLGNLGPLPLRVYQANPPGPLQPLHQLGQGDPNRYLPSLHTIVIVEMPPLADVIKALEDDALPNGHPTNGHKPSATDGRHGESSSSAPPVPPMPSIAGRSLPLLFIRASDGVGYHSGRTIACENIFQAMELGNMAGGQAAGPPVGMDANWLVAAQAAASADGAMHGWTLRVM